MLLSYIITKKCINKFPQKFYLFSVTHHTIIHATYFDNQSCEITATRITHNPYSTTCVACQWSGGFTGIYIRPTIETPFAGKRALAPTQHIERQD